MARSDRLPASVQGLLDAMTREKQRQDDEDDRRENERPLTDEEYGA
jgi:hypothetical protein